MMDLFTAIEKRRSIRAYTDQEVTKEQLLRILEAARISPTWKNGQCGNFIVVQDPCLRRQIGEAAGFNPDQTAYEKAPYLLVLCADPTKSGDYQAKDYYLVDAGIYMEHAVLAAEALGLATCWIGAFPEAPIKEILNIPPHIRVVAMTPVGYADQTRKPRKTKKMEEFYSFDYWEDRLK
ncbi:MAG: nitroreductase family protein [Bacillota bacterium]|jgi:nitroreductase